MPKKQNRPKATKATTRKRSIPSPTKKIVRSIDAKISGHIRARGKRNQAKRDSR